MTKTLNLDELLGTQKTIKIIFGGYEYFMLPPEAMGPRQMAALSNFNKTLSLDLGTEEISEEEAAKIEVMVDKAIAIFCEDLSKVKVPFMGKVQIINFYMEESGLAAKAKEAKDNPGN